MIKAVVEFNDKTHTLEFDEKEEPKLNLEDVLDDMFVLLKRSIIQGSLD